MNKTFQADTPAGRRICSIWISFMYRYSTHIHIFASWEGIKYQTSRHVDGTPRQFQQQELITTHQGLPVRSLQRPQGRHMWWAISGWLHASNWWPVWIIARQMPIPDMSWYVQNYRSRSFWFKVIMKIVAVQHVPSIPSPQTIGSMMIWSSKKHRSFWGPGTLSPRFRLVTSRCWKIIWSKNWIRQIQFLINKPLNKAWICHGFAMFCPRLETFVYNSEL